MPIDASQEYTEAEAQQLMQEPTVVPPPQPFKPPNDRSERNKYARRKKAKVSIYGGPNPKISPLKIEFAKQYVANGHNGTQALIAARKALHPEKAYSTNLSAVSVTASHIKRDPIVQRLIQAADEAIMQETVKSVRALASLRDGSEDEKVQMQSSQNLVSAYLHVAKRKDEEQKAAIGTQNNVLIANMSDEELKRRVAALTGASGPVSGAGEAEVQEGPVSPDAGVPGVSEPSTGAHGDGEDAGEGGELSEGPIPAPSGSLEEHDADGELRAPEDLP